MQEIHRCTADTGEADSPVHLTTMTGAPGAPHLFNNSPLVRVNLIDDDFAETWELYPRKIAKKEALGAYRARRTRRAERGRPPCRHRALREERCRLRSQVHAPRQDVLRPKGALEGDLDPLSIGNEAQEETTTTWVPNWEEEVP